MVGTLRRRLTRAIISLAAMLAVVGVLIPAPAMATGGPAGEVFALTNAEHANAGLPALISDPALDAAAAGWAQYLASTCTFEHSTAQWRSARVAVYGWGATGENIAAGQPKAGSVVTAWMNSSGHKANSLNAQYRGLGVGYATGSCYQTYSMQVFGIGTPVASAGTGAVSVKGPGSELVPDTTIEIRKNTCAGPAVWYSVTPSRPDAYGAFGITLEPGQYCALTLAAPAPYRPAASVMFTMEARPSNWVTVWLPGPVPGALVAKDETGAGVDGVNAYISQGACGSGGGGVWLNTTATSRWSTGGFGISLPPGQYCATAVSVPDGYTFPNSATVTVSASGPAWFTLWTTKLVGPWIDVLPVNIVSGSKTVSFSCPTCTGRTTVRAAGPYGASDLLVDAAASFTGGSVVGPADPTPTRYTQIEVTANAAWTISITPR